MRGPNRRSILSVLVVKVPAQKSKSKVGICAIKGVEDETNGQRRLFVRAHTHRRTAGAYRRERNNRRHCRRRAGGKTRGGKAATVWALVSIAPPVDPYTFRRCPLTGFFQLPRLCPSTSDFGPPMLYRPIGRWSMGMWPGYRFSKEGDHLNCHAERSRGIYLYPTAGRTPEKIPRLRSE